MNIKISHIISAFIIGLELLNFAVAQNKPAAEKFDEFDDISDKYFYAYYKPISPDERTERFIKQLKREKQVKVYIIYYRARLTDDYNPGYESSSLATSASYKIYSETKIKNEDIVVIDGGYREKNTIEFWIVPKNAQPPKPTPSFDKSEAFACPGINVYPYGLDFAASKSVKFSVSTYDLKPSENFKFIWKVTSGEIVAGQGTSEITVKLNDQDAKRVTALVEIKGLPAPCAAAGVATLEVGIKPYLFDVDSNYNTSDLSARMDAYITALQNYLTYRGYIIIYGSRKIESSSLAKINRDIRRIFAFRNYDSERITIVPGGYREGPTVEMWILPTGSSLPQPTPTVDRKFVIATGKPGQKKVRWRN